MGCDSGSLVALAMRWSEFKPLRKVGVENNKIKILEIRRVAFGLVGKLTEDPEWGCPEVWGIQEILLISKRIFLKPQELCPVCKTTSRHSRGPVWAEDSWPHTKRGRGGDRLLKSSIETLLGYAEMELREPKLAEKWKLVHVTGNNLHGFTMDRSYFTHFIASVSGCVEEGRPVTILYLAFSIDFCICRRNWKKCGKYGEENILNESKDWICELKGRWKTGLVRFKRSADWDVTGTYLQMVVLGVWYWIWDIIICSWVTEMIMWDTALFRPSCHYRVNAGLSCRAISTAWRNRLTWASWSSTRKRGIKLGSCNAGTVPVQS